MYLLRDLPWPDFFTWIVCSYFTVLIICALLVYLIPEWNTSPLLEHGGKSSISEKNCKIFSRFLPSSATSRNSDSAWENWLSSLKDWTISKRFFIHFYFVGFITNLFILLSYYFASISISFTQDTLLILFLMQGHFTRRIIECLFVMTYSDRSRMHFFHYLVGISSYLMVEGAIVLSDPLVLGGGSHLKYFDLDSHSLLDKSTWWSWIKLVGGGFLFIRASYHQYECHKVFGRLRPKQKDNDICDEKQKFHLQEKFPSLSSSKHSNLSTMSEYRCPSVSYSHYFKYVYCPHYTFEILIYFSLLLINPLGFFSWALWLNWFWVLINLSISAIKTKTWYENQYSGKDNKIINKNEMLNKKAILPFLL